LVLQIGPGTLPGIAAIEQQAAPGALRPDRLDDGRHAIRPAHGAEAPGEVGKIQIGQRMGEGRVPRQAEFGQKSLPGDMGQPAARFADANLRRSFAEEHRHQLAVQIRHMDQRDLAERRKAQQFILAGRFGISVCCGASAAAATSKSRRVIMRLR
jgi:hypothetical protein